MADLKVIAFAGSFRAASFNKKLLALGVRELEKLGVAVETVDLKALAIPVYDGDDEEKSGLPKPVVELREKLAAAHGVMIASPEYNWGVPGGLKNVIDWLSRPPNQPFKGKAGVVMGASASAFGAVRMQPQLRQALQCLGAAVITQAVMIPAAQVMFDEKGELKDAKRHQEITVVATELVAEMRRRHP